MKVPRFRVATCEGFRITSSDPRGTAGNAKPGLSATVCDTFTLWREMRTYRSEDRVFRGGRFQQRGRDGAEKDAADHAAYLNTAHARALHPERVREGRKRARQSG